MSTAAPPPPGRRGPLRTWERPRPSLLYVLGRTWNRLMDIQVWDVAAAMTFFGTLSLLPTLIALVSLVSLLGLRQTTVDAAAGLASEVWPALSSEAVRDWILSLGAAATGPLALTLGVLGAVFSASGAVGAFHRAMHRIYDTREGRPLLRFRLVLFVETLALMLGLVLVVVLVVLGGDLSARLGEAVGLAEQTVRTWNLAKWPVILVLIMLAVTLAYRRGPNVRPPRYRPLSLGAVSVVVLLFAATLALGWITDRFGELEIVGRINSAIGVLALVWLACIVVLAGAALDAEMLRARQLAVGADAADELQLATRHTRMLEELDRAQHRYRRLGRLVTEAVRSGESLTARRTPLLAEEGGLFSVDAPRRSPADLTSGTPFHAAPEREEARVGGTRVDPDAGPDDRGPGPDRAPAR